MNNVTFITIDEIEHAIIDNGDGSFTSMLKATYEAQEDAKVEHLTEILTPEQSGTLS